MLAIHPHSISYKHRRLLSLRPPHVPLLPLQPILRRIVQHVARQNPALFARLGKHQTARYLVDAKGLPFMLLLCPDPAHPQLQAVHRTQTPPHDACITGKLADLLCLIDGSGDGDALFFSRDLGVTGNIEAVVCLRNALDDVEKSIAAQVADLFGTPGRIILAAVRSNGKAER